MPAPSYPAHLYAVAMAAANAILLEVSDSEKLLANIDYTCRHLVPRPKLLVVNFPHNPTTAVVEPEFYVEVVKLAKRYGFMVISDLAYADVTFDGYKTPSFLAAPGAIDVGVELTTMSKGYNMAGWRVGFAAGNAEMLRALSTIKGYYDYGMFRPIQIAAIMALRHTDAAVEAQAASLSAPPRRALRRAGAHRLAGRTAQGQHVPLGQNTRALGVADELVRLRHETAPRRRRRGQSRRGFRSGRRGLRPHGAGGKREPAPPGGPADRKMFGEVGKLSAHHHLPQRHKDTKFPGLVVVSLCLCGKNSPSLGNLRALSCDYNKRRQATATDTPMSSVTAIPPSPTPETPVAPPTECEVVIQQRLQQTRRQVKAVDIAGGLITLAIGVLAYLLAAAAIDHWLIVGGLGFWGRLWLWLVLVATSAAYFVRRLLPPIARRINPIYAAATIEHSQPSLKNSLINFLLLRGRRREVALPVYQAMEHRAAADLANAEIEVAVDRTHVIRMGCVLAGVLALFCLYLVLSPKSPIRSAARVLWPWSSIEAPTRVTIHDIQPGDATRFHDDFVTISAEVAGLGEGEQPVVIYSTADGQTVDQAIPMTKPEGDYRFQCRLPPGNLGIQQNCVYYLAAGDCRSRRYRIEVQTAPTIVVDRVTYHYPAYTGIADRTVRQQGDLQGIEGTEVTIHATANTEIKPGTAEIDLGCTGRGGLKMSTDGRAAVGRLTLRLNPKDPSIAEYDSYQLRFADAQGRENDRPVRHNIEVIRDSLPDVRLVEPREADVQVPADGRLAIKVWAEDHDYALRRSRAASPAR